jgi:hypothetical protein
LVLVALANTSWSFPLALPRARPVLNALDFDPVNGKWYINRQRAGSRIKSVNPMGVSLKLLDRLEILNRRLRKLERRGDRTGLDEIFSDPVLHARLNPNHQRGAYKRLPISRKINRRYRKLCKKLEFIETVEIETRSGRDDLSDFYKICL